MRNKKSNALPELIQLSLDGRLHLSVTDKEQGASFLVDFFRLVRPRNNKQYRNADQNLQRLVVQLQESPALLHDFRIAILSQLIDTNLLPALTESGLLQSRGFVQEFVARVNHKLLPALQQEDDFLYVVNRIFYDSRDYRWVEEIQRNTWKTLFELVNLPVDTNSKGLQQQLSRSLLVLSYKLVHHALEPEIKQYIPQAYVEDNPFTWQNNRIIHLIAINDTIDESMPDGWVEDLLLLLRICADGLEQIKEIQSTRGASLSLTYTTLVMGYIIERMEIIIDLMDNDKHLHTDKLAALFTELVRNEKRKNSLRELSSQSFGYIAYQIAEHKGRKGDKYITGNRQEYNAMLVSAMWGGFIICFTVIIKKLLGKLAMPPFWQGFAYGTNYAIGFLVIEETHATLATKQPAFTASAVASSLDTKKNEQPNLYNMAVTVAKVTRSQIASFFGNLIVVFPVTFLFAWLYNKAVGHPLADMAHAKAMLLEQDPVKSLSLLYAANTGFFLFLSGLIAGFIQNKMQYGRISERLQKHPVLRLHLPNKRLKRIGDYIEQHAGAIIGNIILGYILGMSGIIMQELFGIPFDIRHITIAAGNAAIAFYTIGFRNVTWQFATVSFIGVLGIGCINFLISFSCAFIVALKSRGIRLRDYPEFLKILWRYFKTYPLHFIRPPKAINT